MMRRALFAGLATTLLTAIGCTCCSQVPVSLESINNWFLYHGPACRHYPNSCPPCPYAGGEAYVAEEAATGQAGGDAQWQRPDNGTKEPAAKARDEGPRKQ